MRTPFRKRQRGLASVEVALVTPALLVVMLVAGEFTRVFYEFNTLNKSVRDAARLLVAGAIDPATRTYEPLTAHDMAQARNFAVTGKLTGGSPLLNGLTISDINIDEFVLGAAPLEREHVRVRATYNFQPLAPIISGMGFLPGDIDMNFTLRASSTMRAL